LFFLKLITSLLLHLFALFRSSLFFQSYLSVSASYNLMPLSQILISFPPVSLVFVDFSTTELLQISDVINVNYFVISTIVALFPSLRWTSQRLFDIVNHDFNHLLLVKLKLCGLSHLSLICSFLTKHTQQVLYNPFTLFSSTHAVFSDVLHLGSILGSLFFNILFLICLMFFYSLCSSYM